MSGMNAVVSPHSIKKALSSHHLYIADGSQHDAHEFFVNPADFSDFVDDFYPTPGRGAKQIAGCRWKLLVKGHS